MIRYRFNEEKEYLKFYAERMEDAATLAILDRGTVNNADEAEHLARFFWAMVDKSIVDEKQGMELPWPEGSEFWSEKSMRSISGYLERAGYEAIWEQVVDEQD